MANLIRSLWRKGGGKPPQAPETGPAAPDGAVPGPGSRADAAADETPHTGSTAQMAAPPKIPALDDEDVSQSEPAEAAPDTAAQASRTSILPNPGAEIVRIRREAAEASQRNADPAAFVRRFVEEREEAETRAEAEAAIEAARERAAFDARRTGAADPENTNEPEARADEDRNPAEAEDSVSVAPAHADAADAPDTETSEKEETGDHVHADDAAPEFEEDYREPSEDDAVAETTDASDIARGIGDRDLDESGIDDGALADRDLDGRGLYDDGDERVESRGQDDHDARGADLDDRFQESAHTEDDHSAGPTDVPKPPQPSQGSSVAAAAVTAAAAAAAAAMPRRAYTESRIEPVFDEPSPVATAQEPMLQDTRLESPADQSDAILAAEPERPFVAFTGVQKTYDGQSIVVKDLNLSVRKGEFLTLLGPSGSGKTTTLMMLAGFEQPTAGEILLDGERVTDMPPHKRGIGFVFQNYALFPHMTVAENLAFPLKVRKMARAAIKDRIANALRMVSLEGFEKRRPHQLSGGQQQRVAVARALVFNPALVLMDEPLGALDRHLREQMQFELKRLHREFDLTVVYVTHDQSEALTLSDRIAVFHDGRIQQIDTPQFLYEHPENAFVAGFVGENNMLPGVVESAGEETAMVKLDGGQTVKASRRDCGGTGSRTVVAVRPEAVSFAPDPSVEGERNIVAAHVEEHVFHGDHQRFKLAIPNGGSITLKAARHVQVLRGDTVRVVFRVADTRAFRPMDTAHAPETPPAPAAPAAKRRR